MEADEEDEKQGPWSQIETLVAWKSEINYSAVTQGAVISALTL